MKTLRDYMNLIEDAQVQPPPGVPADPNKLIAKVSMAGDTKEFDLTGRFKGDARSQLNQASDWLSEFLEARQIDFSKFELRYQGMILTTKNAAANLGILNRQQ